MARQHEQGRHDDEAVRAAGAIFAAHGDHIRRVIQFLVRNPFCEDDAYQNFFLALICRPVPADVENIEGYLYRAIHRDIIDSGRKEAVQRKYSEKLEKDSEISIYNQAPANAIVVGDETAGTFDYLIEPLGRREAEAITLRYRDDFSLDDIASRMGVDKRTVSRYLSSGLKRLRKDVVIE